MDDQTICLITERASKAHAGRVDISNNPFSMESASISAPYGARGWKLNKMETRVLSPAHVAVQGVGEVVVDVGQALRQFRVLCSSIHAGHKEVDKPQQGVLVHWINVGLRWHVHVEVSTLDQASWLSDMALLAEHGGDGTMWVLDAGSICVRFAPWKRPCFITAHHPEVLGGCLQADFIPKGCKNARCKRTEMCGTLFVWRCSPGPKCRKTGWTCSHRMACTLPELCQSRALSPLQPVCTSKYEITVAYFYSF
eukprot:1158917-Pelagomonas_calceolata.AAC.4